MSPLLAASVATPLLLALLLAWPRARAFALAAGPWAALPALACALWRDDAVLALPEVLLGLRFGLDATGRTFLLFTALLWLVAGAAARAYHADDERRIALWTFWLATLAGNLWLVLALDPAGFYAGFALMTFAGYGLVVHTRTEQAWRAGRLYLVLAVLGEAALLAGLLLRIGTLGGGTLPLPPLDGPYATAATVLLFAGFGVKAGVAGLHMWLPLAHPVAPTPASAVLSGAMIKAGVLGWMRFLPLGADAWPAFGATVVALGLVAVFGAVAAGLAQRSPKTLLAYSSVSQMGFLTVGVGAAFLAPAAWPALAAAVTLYALHHGLAKGALFLGVAAAPAVRARRFAFAVAALPAFALAGFPFTSGAAAKAELKAALAALPGPWPETLAWLLPIGALGTTLLLARFLVALAALPATPGRGATLPWLAAVAISLAAAWVVAPVLTLEAGAALAAAAPVLAGVAIAVVVARRRPFAPDASPAVPAGDLIAWLAPPVERAWKAVQRVAAFTDAHHASPPAPAIGTLAPAVGRAERELRRFAVAGFVLLLALAALVGASLLG